jgi:hypothetical protein
MRKHFFFLPILLALAFKAVVQTLPSQMVKGQILEHAIKVPIASATISLLGDMPQSVVSDSNGHFVLKNVSVGRRSILISHIGFKSVTLNNLMVESGKELILNVEMDEDLSVI